MLTITIMSAAYTLGAADDAGTGGESWFGGTVIGSCCTGTAGAGGDTGTRVTAPAVCCAALAQASSTKAFV